LIDRSQVAHSSFGGHAGTFPRQAVQPDKRASSRLQNVSWLTSYIGIHRRSLCASVARSRRERQCDSRARRSSRGITRSRPSMPSLA
jgi:hypothetical protein